MRHAPAALLSFDLLGRSLVKCLVYMGGVGVLLYHQNFGGKENILSLQSNVARQLWGLEREYKDTQDLGHLFGHDVGFEAV
jgi:hypothetical protein